MHVACTDRQREDSGNWKDRLVRAGLSCVPQHRCRSKMATGEVLSFAAFGSFQAPTVSRRRTAFPRHRSVLHSTLQNPAYQHGFLSELSHTNPDVQLLLKNLKTVSPCSPMAGTRGAERRCLHQSVQCVLFNWPTTTKQSSFFYPLSLV